MSKVGNDTDKITIAENNMLISLTNLKTFEPIMHKKQKIERNTQRRSRIFAVHAEQDNKTVQNHEFWKMYVQKKLESQKVIWYRNRWNV